MHEHYNADGQLQYKPTCFLVTAQTALEYCLTLRCQGGHEHAHIIGGNRTSKAAGVWPYGLVSAMIAGATQELATRSAFLPVIARQHERRRGHVAGNEETIHSVADELYLRPDIIPTATTPCRVY